MNESPIVLACEDVTLGYEHKPLLEHLTLTVRAGDYLCIVGENGSGKSTLLRSLLGLLSPLAGKIDCPAPADAHAARLSRNGHGGRALGLFKPPRALFLHGGGEVGGFDEPRQARRAGIKGQVLP